MPTVQEICDFLEAYAPLRLAEEWDNVGLLLGDAARPVERMMTCLTVTPSTVDEAVAKGYTQTFFPHGLGHHLGLQVHDVGGHLKDASGNEAPPPSQYPYLRNTRTIEERHVFTVEPGLYFIEMLLRPFREENHGAFAWKLIDELSPLGGIRIEDNIVVTQDGHRNLTRTYLPH